MAAEPAALPGRAHPRPAWAFPGFVARRAARTAAVWGLVTVLYTYATAVGFVALGSTAAARSTVLDALGSNVGLKALMGDTGRIDTVAGFTDWRAIGVMGAATGIWALMAATRWLRGEEAAGRWELTLAAPTRAGAATARVLLALGAAAAVMWALAFAGSAAVGARGDIAFGTGRVALYTLTIVAAPVVFGAVGAVTSQLMATRARAAATAAAVFGVSYLLRALGDAAPVAHWLVYLSPLGWIEQVRPLGAPHPAWLLPPLALAVLLGLLSVVLAGRRDLGASVLADRDSAPARTRLLAGPLRFALRMTRGGVIAWLLAITIAALLYGTLAHSAGQAFADSPVVRKFAGALAPGTTHLGAQTYAGVIFLILTTLLMASAAAAVSGVRDTEAEGYLDNLLVRRVSRLTWLAGRVGIAAAVVVVGGVLAGAGFWAGAAGQSTGLTAGELLLAGINATAPALLLLGLAVCGYGFLPRATAILAFGLLAWAFLLEMLGSALHLNHWLMDTSLLHHMALAPTVDPNWRIIGTYLALGALAAAAGAWRFVRRDIEVA